QAAAATLLAVAPASLPVAAAGEVFTIALSGSGFVAGEDAAQRTTVGIVAAGSLVADASLSATVVNASNIIVTLTVPASDPLLPFSPGGSGGTVTLGVCNPMGAACTSPTGTVTLAIGARPVIQSVTSASSYAQPSAPNLPTVAPYDMISVFGFNFCTSGGTGCGGSILYGAPDSTTLRYPVSLSPDGVRALTATFQTHATP